MANGVQTQNTSIKSRILKDRQARPVGWGTFTLASLATVYSWFLLTLSVIYVLSPATLSARWLGSIWLNPIFSTLFLPVLFLMWFKHWSPNVQFWGSAYFFNILCAIGILALHRDGVGVIMVAILIRAVFTAFAIQLIQ